MDDWDHDADDGDAGDAPDRSPDVSVSIPPVDTDAREAASARQDSLTKPPGSLGRLESVAVDVAGMTGEATPALERAVVVTAAGDHGVAARGVSAYPQSVTAGMLRNFLAGGAAVNAVADAVDAAVVVVDAGVLGETPAGAVDAKVREGTDDIAAGPAMTRAEAIEAVEAGVDIGRERAAEADAVALGEMGIANTTPSAALTAALADVEPERATGRGTGIDEQTHREKVRVVERALAVNDPDPADALDCLRRVGGFEHGVLAGVALGAATERTPVVVDGHPTGAAALVAAGIEPRVRSYLLPSHASAETGHAAQLDALGLEPLFEYGMRLGEGTGAALALAHYRAACRALREMATFEEAGL